MSIASTIAAYIVMQGRTTSDAVERAFPHLPRRTIQKAITNANQQRLIWIERKGVGGRNGPISPAVVCAPQAGQPQPRLGVRVRVASVWELGNPRALALPGPPGRQYSPLGDWNSEGI